jgi:hypothetical protein
LPVEQASAPRHSALQTRIDWFGFEGEDTEDTLVNTMQRFATNESFKPLDPEAELAHSKASLVPKAALAKSGELLWFSFLVGNPSRSADGKREAQRTVTVRWRSASLHPTKR